MEEDDDEEEEEEEEERGENLSGDVVITNLFLR